MQGADGGQKHQKAHQQGLYSRKQGAYALALLAGDGLQSGR